MKTAIILVLSFASFSSLAQMSTNTDSQGYVTNSALLFPFTLTNSSGDTISNAVLVKLTANKFIYKYPPGGEGVARLDSLPKDLQEKFSYNPTNAAFADKMDAQKKEKQAEHDNQAADALAREADVERRAKIVVQGCRTVDGNVIQKIDAGLLVDCDREEFTLHPRDHYVDPTKEKPLVRELILLEHYTNSDGIVDGDFVGTIAYPMGTYTYTSVQGASKTIRIYTPDFGTAFLEEYLEEKLKQTEAAQ